MLALLCLFTVLSCQKKKEDLGEVLPGGQGETPIDYSFHCEENFVVSWCGVNRVDSEITEVCVGNLYLGEKSQHALSFSRKDKGSECYAFSGEASEADFPGCASASIHEYVADLNGSHPFEAVVCYSGGQPAYVEGASFLGEAFKAFYIK